MTNPVWYRIKVSALSEFSLRFLPLVFLFCKRYWSHYASIYFLGYFHVAHLHMHCLEQCQLIPLMMEAKMHGNFSLLLFCNFAREGSCPRQEAACLDGKHTMVSVPWTHPRPEKLVRGTPQGASFLLQLSYTWHPSHLMTSNNLLVENNWCAPYRLLRWLGLITHLASYFVTHTYSIANGGIIFNDGWNNGKAR
jgi:hypothetical protein